MQSRTSILGSFRTVFILLAITLSVSSCRTLRPLPVVEVKPMSALKVMRRVERAAPIYNNYESKKMSFEFDINNSNNSVSGQFKIKRNKCIILSARKLSIPLGRGMLSPDSIVFVNYFDKSYMAGNFNDVQRMLGIELDYTLIQALFTADVSKLFDIEDFEKDPSADIDSQMYRLTGHSDQSTLAVNERRLIRNNKKKSDLGFNNYSMWIDPQSFAVRKITMNNTKNNENIVISYNQYEQFGRNFFPQEIVFNFNSPTQKVSFLIKLSKSTVNSDNDFSFSIPEQFEKAKFTGAN